MKNRGANEKKWTRWGMKILALGAALSIVFTGAPVNALGAVESQGRQAKMIPDIPVQDRLESCQDIHRK